MKNLFIIFALTVASLSAMASSEYSLTSRVSEKESQKLFQKYCGSDVEQISTQIPKPNYSNELVMSAAKKLNTVAPVSFYMYSAVVKSYGFDRKTDESFPWDTYKEVLDLSGNQEFGMKKNWDTGEEVFDLENLKNKFDYEYVHKDPKYQAPKGVKGNSHAFLTYLCGEFRDRPTLIEDKLVWMTNIIKLPVEKQKKIEPSKEIKNIWNQLTAESYAYYVTFSRAAFNAKEDALKTSVPLGSFFVDKPVPAFTVCEVKYIMTEYITNGYQVFPGYEAYVKGLEVYQDKYCSQDDKDHYYDFRGDSNMKPNSPESNGMIWYATSVMGRCQRNLDSSVQVKSVKENNEWIPLDFPVEICEKYMERPFANRWNAARAALATWLARDIQFDDIFSRTSSTVNILPSFNPELAPFDFSLGDGTIYKGTDSENYLDLFSLKFEENWLSPDLGMNYVFGIENGSVREMDMIYSRLRDAVDRHTDWYASGYDDTQFEPKRSRVIDQAFSPFVASSYEMSESDAFTAPGITVKGPVDGRRQWMYVFKVHKDKWYNTDSLEAGKPLNFETQWFDETSFGTTHLADTERAWDRLGTPLEGEMESIIYLHNIENNERAIKSSSVSGYPKTMEDALGSTQ